MNKLAKLNKLKLPIIILVVLLAGGAGLFVSGIVGGDSKPGPKVPVTPVVLLTEQPNGFTVNLADTDEVGYVVMNVALEPEPMTEEDRLLWTGEGGGGHGGATEAPGPAALANYPKFRDAVIATASTFTSEDLLAKGGQDELKKALLAKFDEIAQRDEAAYGAGKKGAPHNPVHPPYHIQDVYLQNFAVQVTQK